MGYPPESCDDRGGGAMPPREGRPRISSPGRARKATRHEPAVDEEAAAVGEAASWLSMSSAVFGTLRLAVRVSACFAIDLLDEAFEIHAQLFLRLPLHRCELRLHELHELVPLVTHLRARISSIDAMSTPRPKQQDTEELAATGDTRGQQRVALTRVEGEEAHRLRGDRPAKGGPPMRAQRVARCPKGESPRDRT